MRFNTNGRYQNNITGYVQRNIIIGLGGTLVFATLLILLLNNAESKTVGDIMRSASAGFASIVSFIVVYRQKVDGVFGKAYASLALGLTCWFIAETIWSYEEIGLGVKNPFPSVADIFWLIGYGPLVYYIFKTFKLFANSKLSNIIVVSFCATIFLGFYIHGTLSVTEFNSYESTIVFLISISYPIGDVVFIIIATLVVLNSGKGQLTSIPWIFLGMLATAVADSIFGYTSVVGISAEKIWNPVYVVGYVLFGAGLLWHNKFFISDHNSQISDWQEKHR